MQTYTAKAKVNINTNPQKLWECIVNPYLNKIVAENKSGPVEIQALVEGARLSFKGVWMGQEYEDRGIIHQVILNQVFSYQFWSKFWNLPDKIENYTTITYKIDFKDENCTLTITEENLESVKKAEENSQTWAGLLASIKQMLEG